MAFCPGYENIRTRTNEVPFCHLKMQGLREARIEHSYGGARR